MSIWMLLIFAICMLTAVLSFDGPPQWAGLSELIFLVTLAIFLIGTAMRGIRKPVI